MTHISKQHQAISDNIQSLVDEFMERSEIEAVNQCIGTELAKLPNSDVVSAIEMRKERAIQLAHENSARAKFTALESFGTAGHAIAAPKAIPFIEKDIRAHLLVLNIPEDPSDDPAIKLHERILQLGRK